MLMMRVSDCLEERATDLRLLRRGPRSDRRGALEDEITETKRDNERIIK
jgi:hypothetical protein